VLRSVERVQASPHIVARLADGEIGLRQEAKPPARKPKSGHE